MKKYCLALDLNNEEQLIAEYEAHHKKVWPEIIASIKEAGIISMEIYRIMNRLFMIMETTDDFSFEKKGCRRCKKRSGTKLGEFDVEISAGTANCSAW